MSNGFLRRIGLVVAGILLSSIGLVAGTIGPDCGSCFGGEYSLTADLLSSAGSQETWRVTYDLDLTGYDGPSGATYVGSIAAKVTSGSDLVGWNTVLPNGTPTDGTWVDTSGGLNSNGCSGSGGGWVCLEWVSGSQLLVGNTYTWVFDVTIKAGNLLDVGSIKANFDPAKGVILSENISTETVGLPEGEAAELPLILSGLGLLLLWKRGNRLAKIRS